MLCILSSLRTGDAANGSSGRMKKLVEFATLAGLVVAVLAWFRVNPDALLGYRVDVPITAFVIAFAVVWMLGRSLTDVRRFWRWYRGIWKSKRLRALHNLLQPERALNQRHLDRHRDWVMSPDAQLDELGIYEEPTPTPRDQPANTKQHAEIMLQLQKIGLRFPKQHRLDDWCKYLEELAVTSVSSDYHQAEALTKVWQRIIAKRVDPYTKHRTEVRDR